MFLVVAKHRSWQPERQRVMGIDNSTDRNTAILRLVRRNGHTTDCGGRVFDEHDDLQSLVTYDLPEAG
jgi:hypothetical protein